MSILSPVESSHVSNLTLALRNNSDDHKTRLTNIDGKSQEEQSLDEILDGNSVIRNDEEDNNDLAHMFESKNESEKITISNFAKMLERKTKKFTDEKRRLEGIRSKSDENQLSPYIRNKNKEVYMNMKLNKKSHNDIYILISNQILAICDINNMNKYIDSFWILADKMESYYSHKIFDMIGKATKSEFDRLSQEILEEHLVPFYQICKEILIESTTFSEDEIDNMMVQPMFLSSVDCQLDISNKDHNDLSRDFISFTQEKWRFRRTKIETIKVYFETIKSCKSKKDLLKIVNDFDGDMKKSMIEWDPELTKKFSKDPECKIFDNTDRKLLGYSDSKEVESKENNNFDLCIVLKKFFFIN